jgi:hypothetical protein
VFTYLLGKSQQYVLGDILNTCTDFDIKVDPSGDFSYVNDCTRVTVDTMAANIDAYVGKTFPAGYFGTEFSINFEAQKGAGGDKSRCIMLALSNNPIGTLAQLLADNDGIGVYYGINLSQTYVRLYDFKSDNNDIWYRGAYAVPQNWYTFARNGSSLVLRTYDDVDRTSLIKTQSITCDLTDTYKYIHIVGSSSTTSETDPHTGWCQNYSVVELTQRYSYDRQPFQNPLILTDVGYAGNTFDPVIFSDGTLYVRENGTDETTQCVNMTSVVDNVAGTPSSTGTFDPKHWTKKGDNLVVNYQLGNSAYDMRWIEYDGDDFTTETKNLDLDSSWTQALFPIVLCTRYDSNSGLIAGIVNAWSSVPNNYKSWWVRWNYTTGALEPDGADVIYKMSNNVTEYSYWVFDPDDPDLYFWAWRASDYTLHKFDIATATAQGVSMDFSSHFSSAIVGMEFDPNGHLCLMNIDTSVPKLYMFEGLSTTLRSF